MPKNGINGPGFHHVAIRAFDFDATLRFYAEGFGFQRVYGWGEGDSRAALLDVGDGNYLEIFAGGKRPHTEEPSEGAFLHIAFRTPDTDAAFARALAAGARPTAQPKNVDIQGDRVVTVRIAFCKGLDGEIIEFFQNEEL
jgi:glyoxylase I family protein